MHYCPGCGHGTAHRILAEIIEEEGLQQIQLESHLLDALFFLYKFIWISTGRKQRMEVLPALATAIKRLLA